MGQQIPGKRYSVSLGEESRGDSAEGQVLTTQTQGLKWDPSAPIQKPGYGASSCNPSAGRVETDGYLGPELRLAYLVSSRFSDRPCPKSQGRYHLENKHPRFILAAHICSYRYVHTHEHVHI